MDVEPKGGVDLSCSEPSPCQCYFTTQCSWATLNYMLFRLSAPSDPSAILVDSTSRHVLPLSTSHRPLLSSQPKPQALFRLDDCNTPFSGVPLSTLAISIDVRVILLELSSNQTMPVSIRKPSHGFLLDLEEDVLLPWVPMGTRPHRTFLALICPNSSLGRSPSFIALQKLQPSCHFPKLQVVPSAWNVLAWPSLIYNSFTEMSPLQRDLFWPENPKSFLSQHIILIFCRAVSAIWCFSCLRVCLFPVYPHEDASSSEAGALPCLELYFLEQKEVCSQKVWLATLMECLCVWMNGLVCADHEPRGVPGTQGAVAFGYVVLQWHLSHLCADLSSCPGDWVYKN